MIPGAGSTVLVTGGAGFLGSRVVEMLAADPGVRRVIVGDITRPASLPAGATFSTLDVTDTRSIDDVFAAQPIDVVVHLAAIVNPGGDVEREYRVDVEGSANVFARAAAAGVERLVVSSSGAAYGYHADNPDGLVETDPLRGNDEFPYSKHKRLVEEMLADYRVSHPQMTQTILRIGTILGPGVDNQITRLWEGKRILHIAGADSPFVFIWVDDVARIMARAATDGPAGIYNVAGDGVLTVPQIARRLGKKLQTVPAWALTAALRIGHTLRLTEHGPEKVRFLRYRPVLDNTALKEEFGYTPRYTTAEAFEAFLDARVTVRE